MDAYVYNTAKTSLLAAAMVIAPTGVEQRQFSELVRKAEMAGTDPREIIRRLSDDIARMV